MILTKEDLQDALNAGHIIVEPIAGDAIGTNSIDLHLSPYLATYDQGTLDAKQPANIRRLEMTDEGYVLTPGTLYLASTLEYTETHRHIPIMHGKSSPARLGITVHQAAGFGDIGFCGHWTMEITVAKAVKVYPGLPIAQLCYIEPKSMPEEGYMQRKSSTYTDARNPLPQPSGLWRKFLQPKS